MGYATIPSLNEGDLVPLSTINQWGLNEAALRSEFVVAHEADSGAHLRLEIPQYAWKMVSCGAGATNNVQVLTFADGAVQVIDNVSPVPKGWPGKALKLGVLWSPSTTNAGTAKMDMEMRAVKDTVLVDGTVLHTPDILSGANGTANKAQKALSASFNLDAGFVDGGAMAMRFYRDGSAGGDSFTGVVQVYSVWLELA